MIDRFVLASFALLVLTLGPGCASGSWGTDYSGAAGKPGARRVQTDVLQLPATPAAPAGRVLLISVTGLAGEAYADTAAPAMPTLDALARDGVRVDRLDPVTPASTYPGHATLVTGRLPASHGITGDQVLSDSGIHPVPPWHASRLRGESLWGAAQASGRSVISLGWPTTVGAAISLLVPDLYPMRRGDTWIDAIAAGTSPWLLERLRVRMPSDAPAGWPDLRERDALVVDLACDAARLANPPQLWLLRLVAPSEPLWREGPDSSAMRSALAQVDAEIDRLLGCLAASGQLAETSVVVVGDQAWLSVHTRIEPNIALRGAGLIARDPRLETGVRVWKAIVRSNGGSAFVYAKDDASALLAREVLSREAEATSAFRIVPASEMSRRGADPEAWFGLEARPGYVFGNEVRGSRILSASPVRGAGGYFDRGVGHAISLVGWGAGLRQGVTIPMMPAVDVAPTLALLLEVPLQEADGRPFVGALAFDPDVERSLRESERVTRVAP